MFPTTFKKLFKNSFIFWCISCGLLIGFTPTRVGASPDYWPTQAWRSSTPEAQGMDSGKLIEMLELVRNEEYAINSISIVRNGFLVVDAYFYPFQKNNPHFIASVTKSVTSALIGIAIQKGYIPSIHQPILDFFPEKSVDHWDEQKQRITLEHLLIMSSGLDTRDDEHDEFEGLAQMAESENWVQSILDRPMVEEPGTEFDYSNGVSHLLAAILYKTTKMTPLEFAKKHLFGPLGIRVTRWPSDPQGINWGFSHLQMAPYDMAKFGFLYLNHGRWEDQQIIPKAWVKNSTREHISGFTYDKYGYQWWMGTGLFYMDVLWRLKWDLGWKSVRSEQVYMAVGSFGQYIMVVPAKNIVVVFTSNLEHLDLFVPKGLLDEYIIPAVASSAPLAPQLDKQNHLNALISTLAEAPTEGISWSSENTGTAKNGTFRYDASPSFKFTYPKISLKQTVRRPDQVMSMKTLIEDEFSASIREIPKGIDLAEVGPKVFTKTLEEVGSDVQILSNQQITLKDGQVAYRTDIDWKWNSALKMRTLLVSAYKEGKWISVEYQIFVPYHLPSLSESMEVGSAVIESLTY